MPALHPLINTPNHRQNQNGDNDHRKNLQLTTPSKLIRSEDLFLVSYQSTMCADARIIELRGMDHSGADVKGTSVLLGKGWANWK